MADQGTNRQATTDYMQGLGMLPSLTVRPVAGPTMPRPSIPDAVPPQGPAISLPGGGNTIGAGLAQATGTPVGAPASPVAGGGANGPTMTPQELVAAKQASVGPFFNSIIGPGAAQARSDLTSDVGQGNYAAAAGDAIRGVGLTAAYGVSQPVVALGSAALAGAGHALAGVGHFAQGLFGTSHDPGPTAVPAQVATPAAPAAPVYNPAADPGLQLASRTATAALQARAGAPTDRGLVLPGAAAPSAAAVPTQVAKTPFEADNGLDAGTMKGVLANAKPSEVPGIISQMAQLNQGVAMARARNVLVDSLLQQRNQGQAEAALPEAQRAEVVKSRAAALTAELLSNRQLTGLVNPATLTAGNPLNSFQTDPVAP